MIAAHLCRALRTLFRLSEYSDDFHQRITARHLASANYARMLGLSGDVLDVGCSTGYLCYLMADLPELRLTGIDPDRRSLEKARLQAPRATYAAGSALKLPFQDGRFDAAAMFEVLEHLPIGTEERAFREIHRVLKPGATFVMSTPYRNIFATLLDPAWYFGHRHYSKRRIAVLLERSGFEVQHMAVKGAWYEISGSLQMYFYKWALRAEIPNKDNVEARRNEEFLDRREGMTNIFVTSLRGALPGPEYGRAIHR